MSRSGFLPSVTFLLAGAVVAGAAIGQGAPLDAVPLHTSGRAEQDLSSRLAEQVTIYRDAYGVPHVHGETDAAAVFGMMYAQAEDALHRIEGRVLFAIGRSSEVSGETGLSRDLRVRALETERHSRAEYESAAAGFRAIADAWAAGLELYRAQHPKREPSPLSRFEPWHLFALGRIVGSETVPSLAPEGPLPEELRDLATGGAPPGASNMWLLGPSRSASGRSMLFVNPHVPVHHFLLLREGHLLSGEGLDVYGGFWPGDPFPAFGHGPRHGWAVTVNFADLSDLWKLTFDHPTDPLAYRYGDGYRRAEEWTETVRVRTGEGLEERDVTFRKSHHGPVVAVRDGESFALRVARYEEGGMLQQYHAMARARSYEEFRDAVGRLSLLQHNIGYADREGNIWYVYNGPVPRRSERFDWSRPVDGSDPETGWRGYHTLDELPQVLNPKSGWIVNTNASPFQVTVGKDNPRPEAFPGYMVGEVDTNPVYRQVRDFTVARREASRQILTATERFDLDTLAAAATSRRVFQADADLPVLVEEWKRLGEADPERAETLQPAIEALMEWDRISALDSEATTLYARWSFEYRKQPASWFYGTLEARESGEWARIRALEIAVAALRRDWGTILVPWGEISRLQRPVDGIFSDERPSTPVAGGPGIFGILHEFNPMPASGQKRWYGRGGNSYVSVVEFGPEVRARTVMPFGQSADPESPHFGDQSALYGRGELKAVSTTLEETRANAVRSYRPGEETFVALGITQPVTARVAPSSPVHDAGIVHVAPPTGDEATDRASILAAMEKVAPGGTVQFAAGTYLIGEILHVTVPGITVLGDPEGTILRGCDPEDGALDRMLDAVVRCNGLDMAGGRQSVRDITFEHAWSALILGGLECRIPGGCRPHGEPVESREGGYRVEGNTFRAVANAVRTLGEWDDPAVIRDNEFIDTFHAVVIHGSTVHVLENDIRTHRPERVPGAGHPGGALLLGATDLNLELSLRCAGNVIEGNRVDGHPTAIGIWLLRPGTSCRDNVIRGNTIRIARVKTPDGASNDPSAAATDAPAVGIPISLVGSREAFGWHESAGATDQGGVLEDNLIEGNRILGAEGLGIELFRASRNRILDNTILDVRRRQPFPGRTVNSTDPERSGWGDANGSAIWLSPGSDGNEIVGNRFEDVTSAAVVLEGDRNRVVTESASDGVRDLGTGNLVIGPEETDITLTGVESASAPDAIRSVEVVDGNVVGGSAITTSAETSHQPEAPRPIVLENVTLIDGTGAELRHGSSIVVSAESIRDVEVQPHRRHR